MVLEVFGFRFKQRMSHNTMMWAQLDRCLFNQVHGVEKSLDLVFDVLHYMTNFNVVTDLCALLNIYEIMRKQFEKGIIVTSKETATELLAIIAHG
ncbi:hypothetical protein Hamer_G027031 [Homarus americanus]|uniref:FERM domain-containing protein n=1 Tax=Homarus americanus TaxID=6706 RepID=A0A8J5JAR6_HOMAM|nr:hypothetical protein Hamer_G027031 [Homarus americanus]